MPIRKPTPSFAGEGHVHFCGHDGPVHYVIKGDPARLRPGPARLRGSVQLTPELAEEGFRAGEGVLRLEGGAQLRLQMIAHSDGSPDLFVEVRV